MIIAHVEKASSNGEIFCWKAFVTSKTSAHCYTVSHFSLNKIKWRHNVVSYSSAGIATSYRLDSRGSIPSRGKIFLFSIASRPALEPTQLPIQWVREGDFPGLKRPGRGADHLLLSSAKIKNGGVIPSLSPYFFMAWYFISHGNFTIYMVSYISAYRKPE
jgi:hypothetical protein